jgi:transcriptional regulator with XRE-family HTH domain
MREDILLHLGPLLKKFRQEKNLTLSQVAFKVNVSKGLLSKIENGHTVPSLPVLLQLIKCLEVNPSYFFTRMEKSYNFLENAS